MDYFARDCHGLGMKSDFDRLRYIQNCRVMMIVDDKGKQRSSICIQKQLSPSITINVYFRWNVSSLNQLLFCTYTYCFVYVVLVFVHTVIVLIHTIIVYVCPVVVSVCPVVVSVCPVVISVCPVVVALCPGVVSVCPDVISVYPVLHQGIEQQQQDIQK
jgi:hypothetical protein